MGIVMMGGKLRVEELNIEKTEIAMDVSEGAQLSVGKGTHKP
jgi:hypothetical protein